MKANYIKMLCVSAMLFSFASCDDSVSSGSAINETLNSQVIDDFSNNLPLAVYNDLASKTSTLYDQVIALDTDGATLAELTAAQATWKLAREAWEQSEAFLFGPVATDNIDPRIDTWPVNFTDLDAQLDSENEFTAAYIDNLDDALKGFHPIEYLIFGQNGTKTPEELTASARERAYLKALALNLKTLTADLKASWQPTATTYHAEFSTAGEGSATYPTQKAAFEELVNAMAGIADEVANGKIAEVYEAKDASLEESPFAKNSIKDFTNNIKGIQDVYLGKYSADGKGLEDLVKEYNLQLDTEVKAKVTAAISSLQAITDPFGTAINSQATLVQNAITAINDLKTTLETSLLPFVQQHSK